MSTNLQALSFSLPMGSVEAYMERVNRIPMLSAEEEVQLAKQLHEEGDLAAAQQLILAHLRYVVRIARGFSGYGLPIADLIQEGSVGLMKAVKRFDPYKGFRLVSFAVHWIKAEIHDYVIKNWRIVKIATTKAQRKLFFNLRSAKQRLGWFTPEEVQAVAHDLGVKPEEVLEMEARLNAHDMAFDAPSDDQENISLPAPEYFLHDETDNPIERLQMFHDDKVIDTKLVRALQKLDPRSQDIVSQRWLEDDGKTTLQDLATKYSISAERVRQLEVNAMKKLREEMVDDR